MTDMCVRPREEERLAPVVRPAHEVWRSSVAADLDDLAISHRPPSVAAATAIRSPTAAFIVAPCVSRRIRTLGPIEAQPLRPQCRKFWRRTSGPKACNDRDLRPSEVTCLPTMADHPPSRHLPAWQPHEHAGYGVALGPRPNAHMLKPLATSRGAGLVAAADHFAATGYPAPDRHRTSRRRALQPRVDGVRRPWHARQRR